MNMHCAIPTSNVDASLKFYQTLGFAVIADYQKPEESLHIIRIEKDHQMIELMEHPLSATIQFSKIPELQHIGIAVENLDQVLHGLQAQGVKVFKQITDGVKVKRFAFIADPSGFPIELFEEK